MNLYEIVSMYMENENETDQQCYKDTKELLFEELNNKSSNIIKVLQNFEGNITAIDQEIKRLTELKQSNARKRDTLKDYVSRCMTESYLDKVETPIGTLSFRKSERLIIEDESKIPQKFITIKQTESINKNDVKKAIKDGEKIEGARVESFKNLQIK